MVPTAIEARIRRIKWLQNMVADPWEHTQVLAALVSTLGVENYDTLNDDGSVSRVISIGVPRDHPFADPESGVGTSGLHNLRIGPIRLPVAPTFVVRVRRGNRANT